jgi:hypothetical protein
MLTTGEEGKALAAAAQRAAETGTLPPMRGRRDNGSGFPYFDAARNAGVVLEVRKAANV